MFITITVMGNIFIIFGLVLLPREYKKILRLRNLQENFTLKKITNCLNQDELGARTPNPPQIRSIYLTAIRNCTASNKYLSFTKRILY
jgi:hypothetical protein